MRAHGPVEDGSTRQQVRHRLPNGNAGDTKVLPKPVVALNQHTHGVSPLRGSQNSRGRANASLELMADHARSASDVPLANSSTGRIVQSREHMLRLDVKAVDVIEAAVVCLCNDRQSPRLQSRSAYLPLKDGVPNDADTVSVRDRDRILDQAALLHPRRPGHLTVAIQREPCAEYGIRALLPSRENDCHATSDRALSDLPPSFT